MKPTFKRRRQNAERAGTNSVPQRAQMKRINMEIEAVGETNMVKELSQSRAQKVVRGRS